ncbi:hypothetical protein AtubIFM55763_002131 [Aspergillus tubingensis]|uniref:non-specific serine/threonine protein kinase n=1 Tax=Aspergillus niger TaxID=5061 RepID=A0A117E2D7_ASPNG|nr:hypothetical protein AKAW_07917 [Aspergillus niger]GLA57638.1 hypothetical protein AtubIFM54640_005430 [Aspergillus tubingensis]GLA71651.1 hypothetical protein AtubIFM55763_002131 [Aspergillus tubingensis]GLA97958.1 hypothetical protein AtubIFM57143_005891 [Aspergillus tubingensis]
MSTFTPLKSDKTNRDTDASNDSRTSTARPSKPQYRLIEDVEDPHRYCPGGYHPLEIGDDLNKGRYRLVDKLGYGGYSTIWLARDLHRARYVAVKAITADASISTPEASLSSLGNSPLGLGSEIIPRLLDEFWIAGPNGKHRLFITPPARMSLFDAKEASTFGLFHLDVARSIVARLIRGVAFLHSRDIVHGDLHLGNILVQFPREEIDTLSTAELYETFGEPFSEAVIRLDSKPLVNNIPARVFIPGWYGVPSNVIILGEEKILLSDFGESFNPHETARFSSKTLPLLQPPEARFSNEPLSFPSDVWILACTIWEIIGQRPLFEAFFATPDRVTAEQVETLGVLRSEWWEKWSGRWEWFNDEEGKLNLKKKSRGPDGVRMSWDRRFEYCIQEPRAQAGLEIVSETERRAFKAMLLSMLAFRPNERATVQHVLSSEWMRGWGRPALDRAGVI